MVTRYSWEKTNEVHILCQLYQYRVITQAQKRLYYCSLNSSRVAWDRVYGCQSSFLVRWPVVLTFRWVTIFWFFFVNFLTLFFFALSPFPLGYRNSVTKIDFLSPAQMIKFSLTSSFLVLVCTMNKFFFNNFPWQAFNCSCVQLNKFSLT